MNKKKYVLYPGSIRSQHDGDRHHISAARLANLYGVSMAECVVVDMDRPSTMRGVDTDGLIALHPRRSGNYELPRSQE